MDEMDEPYKMHEPGTRGRPAVPPKEIVICLVLKVLFVMSYNDISAFLTLLCGNCKVPLLKNVPAANTIQEHVKDVPKKYLDAVITELLRRGGHLEITVVIDASGLSTEQYGQWLKGKHARKKVKKKFVKIHFAIDLRSNMVIAGLSSKGYKHDSPFGHKLLKILRKRMKELGITIDKVIEDSGYLSRAMCMEIAKLLAAPFIKMKKNTTSNARRMPEWKAMINLQKEHIEEFMRTYCYRVVIEGIISAIKKNFGPMVFSKKRENQDKENMCRYIAWNLFCLAGGEF